MRLGRPIQPTGPYCDVFDAVGPNGTTVRVGVTYSRMNEFYARGQRHLIAQYYGLVQECLTLPGVRHLFKGVSRDMCVGDDMKADQHVFAYSTKPNFDAYWYGDPGTGESRQQRAPVNSVFVVLVTEQEMDEWNVQGVINHWSWIDEDRSTSGAPVDWNERYDTKVELGK